MLNTVVRGFYCWGMAYVKVDRSHQHRITDIDREARTGTCSICGPVKVRIHSTGKGAGCWNRELERRKLVKQTASPEARRRHNLKKMGLTVESYDAMLEAQGGVCAICKTPPTVQRLHIDHDHTCCPKNESCGDCVRGLLCGHCNRALGLLQESPEVVQRALSYLGA